MFSLTRWLESHTPYCVRLGNNGTRIRPTGSYVNVARVYSSKADGICIAKVIEATAPFIPK